jgi:hypothetical protein
VVLGALEAAGRRWQDDLEPFSDDGTSGVGRPDSPRMLPVAGFDRRGRAALADAWERRARTAGLAVCSSDDKEKACKPAQTGAFITGADAIDAIPDAIEQSGGSTNGATLANVLAHLTRFQTLGGPTSVTPALHGVTGRPLPRRRAERQPREGDDGGHDDRPPQPPLITKRAQHPRGPVAVRPDRSAGRSRRRRIALVRDDWHDMAEERKKHGERACQ